MFAIGIFVIFWTDTGFHDIFEMRTFLFFLEITCFRLEKTFEFLISDGKSFRIFGLHLIHLIQTRINFSCPRAPLEFTQINFSCPPQNLFLLPQSRYSGAGPVQLGPMKNTTRHKIGLNPAWQSGGAL